MSFRTVPMIAVALAAGSVAQAAQHHTTLAFQSNSARSSFGYSLLHGASSNGGESGPTYARFTGTMSLIFDDVARTLTVTAFDGVFDGGTISLGGGASMFNIVTSIGPEPEDSFTTEGFVAGNLNLIIDDGTMTDSLTFNFIAENYNLYANRFFSDNFPNDQGQPASYALGLWGMSEGNDGLFGDDNEIGIDIYAVSIPLPMPAALGLAGLGLIAGVRRR